MIEKTNDNITGKGKTSGDAKSQNKKQKRSTDTRSEKKNEDSDSDTSVQKTIPKKNRKCCISDLGHDDKDSLDGVPKRGSVKKKKRKNNSHDALLEREHDSQHRITDRETLWLQDKNKFVL